MKNPAYAKSLIERRRAGNHPEHVVVIYGNDWWIEEGVTRLALKPGEARGLSWTSVAGLPVRVLDRARDGEDEPDEHGTRELYYVLGEIAASAATLTVTSVRDGLKDCEVRMLARACRLSDLSNIRWPAWWSDDIERIHGQNTERWIAEIAQALCT